MNSRANESRPVAAKHFLSKSSRITVIPACLLLWYATNLFSGLHDAISESPDYESVTIPPSDRPGATTDSNPAHESFDLAGFTSQEPHLPLTSNQPIAISDEFRPICRDVVVGREAYVCEGPEYDAYADRLEEFVAWAHARGNISTAPSYFPEDKKTARTILRGSMRKQPFWGRRQHPFPANSTILVVGNSHTRGIFQTIECQYPTLSYEQVEADAENATVLKGTYYRIEFANHAKLHLLTNHAMLYSPYWQQHVEDRIGLKLKDLDAIVLGKVIEYEDAVNTTFMKSMVDQTAKLEDADFEKIQSPGLTEFARAYSGPIVAHSIIANWWKYQVSYEFFADQLDTMNYHNRKRASSIRVVDGRRFSPLLGDCSTDAWRQAGICENDISRHPCVGKRGGHGDLVAWEIIEHLHELWERNSAFALSTSEGKD